MSLSDAQAIAVALWVAHTHAVDAADTTAYLNITSAEKQCGKTRLLEVLSLLVLKPWLTGSVSKAVLVRKLEAERPTLLLDESDAAFAGDKEYSEALRAILNCGHSRDGVASLCVGQGTNVQFKDFHVFGPKAIAGIGKLPDTVADRSIPIRMKRRAANENVERFRQRHFKEEANDIRKQLADWIAPNIQMLRGAMPDLPDLLSDRQQDGCEPLLAIADNAGADWPRHARKALLEILTGEAAEDNSAGVQLLADVYTVFQQKQVEKLTTAELLNALWELQPQWLEFRNGQPLSAAGFSRLLKGYGISHRKFRFGGTTRWGYERESFRDAWVRYLRRDLEQVEQCSADAAKAPSSLLEHRLSVPAEEILGSSADTLHVPCVPDHGNNGEQKRRCHIHGTDAHWWERSPIGRGDWVCADCHPEFRAPTAKDIGFELT